MDYIINIILNYNETINHNRLDNIIHEIHNANKNDKFILILSYN
jgi:hypothetical protein